MIRALFFSCSLFSLLQAEQKVVLISGGTGGIGREMVKTFQEGGWKVWCGYRDSLPEELQLENVQGIPLDVTNENCVRQAVQTVLAKDGKIDALINNAGIGLLGAEECVTLAEARHIFEVNFFGALHLIQCVCPQMREQKSGHIINISSTSGVRALPGLGLYAASKFALEGLSESLAATLSPWNIKVSIVEPGSVRNDWAKHAPTGSAPLQDGIYSLLKRKLLDRLLAFAATGQTCEEIAAKIFEIANTEKPDMRYQTSPKLTELVAKKFVDPTGNTLKQEQVNLVKTLLEDPS